MAETMNFDTLLDFISRCCSFTKAANVIFFPLSNFHLLEST